MAIIWSGCQGRSVSVDMLAEKSLLGKTVTVSSMDGSQLTGMVTWVRSDSIAIGVGSVGLTPSDSTMATAGIESITIQDEKQFVGHLLGLVLLLAALGLFVLEFVIHEPILR